MDQALQMSKEWIQIVLAATQPTQQPDNPIWIAVAKSWDKTSQVEEWLRPPQQMKPVLAIMYLILPLGWHSWIATAQGPKLIITIAALLYQPLLLKSHVMPLIKQITFQ